GTANDWGYSVRQTSDGGYILTGYTQSFGAGLADVYLIKIDSTGIPLWTKSYGGIYIDGMSDVQQTNDGGYIMVGETESFGAGGFHDTYLIKLNSNGGLSWSKTFGGIGDDWGESVNQTTDGGYIIVGSSNSFGGGSYDFYL